MSRQISLSGKDIKEKVEFLDSKLPHPPTATDEIFQLPAALIKKIYSSDYSQASIQELADLLGYYLSLLKPIKVTIGKESSPDMLMGRNDYDRLDRVGLYKTYGYDHSEIEITKKFVYDLPQILAILVHESIHNYLHHHGVRYVNERENEILTDIAAAYLGLGHIIYKGYKPITWIDNEKFYFSGYSYTKHTATIGYVSPNAIFHAIIESTKLRGLKVKDALKNFGFFDRILMYMYLLPYIKKQKSLLKKKIEQERILKINNDSIFNLSNKIKLINSKYLDLEVRFKNIPPNTKILNGDNNVNSKIVEILNKLSTYEVEGKIKSIIWKIEELRLSGSKVMDFTLLEDEINEVNAIIEDWNMISMQLK